MNIYVGNLSYEVTEEKKYKAVAGDSGNQRLRTHPLPE
jgi:hypothetical protein